jgi:crotonobetainyl-CoA:carnitine CoA-transferase CaiB-like acyl-CoA transferase
VENKSPFSQIRIVEAGEGISAAFGAKMIADLGAEVIKIEPPGGDLTRRRGPFPGSTEDLEKSGMFIYLNANKRGVVADLTKPEGQELLGKLLANADILIHNIVPDERADHGLDSQALLAKFPKLIVTSVSRFGDAGPYADWKGYELTSSHAGGWAYLSPGASPFPEQPPLKCFGSQCEFQGGIHAAMVSLAAYIHRMKSGKGQSIDVSEQECIAAMLENNFMHWTYAHRQTSRLGRRLLGPWFITDCADGKIFAVTVEEHQWKALVELMGNPDWAQEELFKDRMTRAENMDALMALSAEWFASWKVQDLYREAQKRRIPFAPVNTMSALYKSDHLAERKFFVDLDQPGVGTMHLPGAPTKYGTTQWSLRRPAPRLGEHEEEVYCGELGLSADRLKQLRQAHVA